MSQFLNTAQAWGVVAEAHATAVSLEAAAFDSRDPVVIAEAILAQLAAARVLSYVTEAGWNANPVEAYVIWNSAGDRFRIDASVF